MRTLAIAAMLLTAMVMAVPAPASAQCQVRCFDHCWMTSRGRCCRRQCVRQCYEPRYLPPPQPIYAYTPTYQPGLDIHQAAIAAALLAAVVLVVGIVAAANQSSNVDALIHDTTQRSNEAHAMRAATAATRAEIEALDQAMEREATAAFQRGRARAERDHQRDRHG